MNQEPLYTYEARNIEEVLIDVVLLYVLGRSIYIIYSKSDASKSDASKSDAKYMLSLKLEYVIYIFKWFGLKPPQSINLMISYAYDVFVILVVTCFLIFTLHLLNIEHSRRILSINIPGYFTYAAVFIFKAVIMFLIYELIHFSCENLENETI